jgi:hypothetical protein
MCSAAELNVQSNSQSLQASFQSQSGGNCCQFQNAMGQAQNQCIQNLQNEVAQLQNQLSQLTGQSGGCCQGSSGSQGNCSPQNQIQQLQQEVAQLEQMVQQLSQSSGQGTGGSQDPMQFLQQFAGMGMKLMGAFA